MASTYIFGFVYAAMPCGSRTLVPPAPRSAQEVCMNATDYILQIITLFGGIALFLFGMDVMGKALEKQAGGKLQNILAKMSSSAPKGFILGLAATALIQSSSATTIMLIGFVNSGIMTLSQTVGVIMGANVGTTVTAWLISLTALEGDSLIVQLFNPTTLAPLFGIIGIVLVMFTKSERKRGIGTIMLGFMALMTGINIMSSAMEFLKEEAWFSNLMISFSNPVLGIIVGIALTAIIQSSSASVGILQGLCATGIVTYGTAIPMILGQNIGACFIALIAAIGSNRNARRTAMVHLYFNVIGVLLFGIAFYTVNAIVPWAFLGKAANEVGIAIVHTSFNLLTTAVLLPINRVLVKLAVLTVPEAKEPEKQTLLDTRLIATPTVALQRALDITFQMIDCVHSAFTKGVSLTHSYDQATLDEVAALEDQTDKYEDALGTYLVRLSGEELMSEDAHTLSTLLYTISDFERIADHAVAIGEAGREISLKSVRFSDQAQTELLVLENAVADVLDKTHKAFLHRDFEMAAKVEPQEQVVDELVREIKSRHINRLRNGKCTVEYGFVLEDLLTAYERIADHCSNIAIEMLQAAEGKMDAHEYLGALKAGELRESEIFEERYEKYLKKYSFPSEKSDKE